LSKKFLTPVGLPSGSENPSVGTIGALFYRSDLSLLHIYTGTSWVPVGSGSDTSAIDGGIVGEGSFLIGGQASTSVFSRTADGGAPNSVSFQGSYSGGTV
jgi:hypothetical protein